MYILRQILSMIASLCSITITQAALSQMESGESRLRKATLVKLAAAMGLNSEQLI